MFVKVLMFGWEFPPFKSGGLGTACYDLTKGLSRQDVEVTFVMPKAPEGARADFVKLLGANNFAKHIRIKKVDSILTPYQSYDSYSEELRKVNLSLSVKSGSEVYGKNLYEEVYRYSIVAAEIAKEEEFDVIHVHDWMTYEAGIRAKELTGKPLVAHIHATEFDRTGGNPNSYISSLEYKGLDAADIVIANSNFTKENVVKHYNINPSKIVVVHWGIDPDNPYHSLGTCSPFGDDEKVVLFLGRITIQKGPDYFVEMAARVLDHCPNTKFVVAGSGDMMGRMVERAGELGILDNFVFTGWLKGVDVHKAFQLADLYVMPSVAEPFGLVALESLKNGTPVIISKQSGVSEVLNHALKVDFWDVNEMTNKVVGCLKYPALLEDLKDNSYNEVQSFNLDVPAQKVKQVYEKVLSVVR